MLSDSRKRAAKHLQLATVRVLSADFVEFI